MSKMHNAQCSYTDHASMLLINLGIEQLSVLLKKANIGSSPMQRFYALYLRDVLLNLTKNIV